MRVHVDRSRSRFKLQRKEFGFRAAGTIESRCGHKLSHKSWPDRHAPALAHTRMRVVAPRSRNVSTSTILQFIRPISDVGATVVLDNQWQLQLAALALAVLIYIYVYRSISSQYRYCIVNVKRVRAIVNLRDSYSVSVAPP